MRLTYAPMDWTGPRRTNADRRHDQFRATWNSTRDLLNREIEYLGGDNVVWQLDYTAGNIRRDGLPRADAKRGDFPGVRILFDTPRGQLEFATDLYHRWEANVRAIALSLEALRAVDRHGVTSGTEQYKGFLAIESNATPLPGASGRPLTAEQAGRLLVAHAPGWDLAGVLADPQGAYRAAARRAHPDGGGTEEDFRLVQRAREAFQL